MVLHGTTIGPISYDTGANSGDREETTNLPTLDLSACEAVEVIITVTTLDAAADDTFDVFFEETFDGTLWDQRMHSAQFSGDMSPTEERRYRILARPTLNAADAGYETSDSAGASDLAAGAVKPGPFAPKRYNDEAPWTLQPSHRLRFLTDDNDNDARFTCTVRIVVTSPC